VGLADGVLLFYSDYMNIEEALKWGYKQISESKLPSANSLDADVLLSDVTKTNRATLRTHPNVELIGQETKKFQKLLKQRLAGRPVEYIIGHKYFYGRRFLVTTKVLLPQPDTETLIEEALKYNSDKTKYVDIGTGSGAIAITLAAETGKPTLATDTFRAALKLAHRNAERYLVDDKIEFRKGAFLKPIIKEPWLYDDKLVIVANLPYLSEKQWEEAPREVHHEPIDALISGKDGLDHYRQLFQELKEERNILPQNLIVIIEIDPSQSETILEVIQKNFPEATPNIAQDLAGRSRAVTCKI